MRQRARCRNHTRGHAAVIAVSQHDGQRDQAHRDNRSRHHAGGGRQQRPHQNNGNGQTATQWAKQLANGVEQILGHAASFQNQPHEGKERNGQQRVVLHDAKQAQGQGLHQRLGQDAQLDADKAKKQATGAQAESHRKAQQQEDNQPCKHDGGDVVY